MEMDNWYVQDNVYSINKFCYEDGQLVCSEHHIKYKSVIKMDNWYVMNTVDKQIAQPDNTDGSKGDKKMVQRQVQVFNSRIV